MSADRTSYDGIIGVPFADLYNMQEDDRIALMGNMAAAGKVIGFFVEDNTKADRYIEKLKAYKVRVVMRGAGIVPGTIFVKIGPAES